MNTKLLEECLFLWQEALENPNDLRTFELHMERIKQVWEMIEVEKDKNTNETERLHAEIKDLCVLNRKLQSIAIGLLDDM